jgi:hypothetical protein
VSGVFHRPVKASREVVARAGLARGDRPLAQTPTTDGGWLFGTRDALVVIPADPSGSVLRIRWQDVETADWDREEERLRVSEVGEFGQVRPVHEFSLADPGRLLPMVRERVTASVLLQRRVPVTGSTGLTVVARRSPQGDGGISWALEYDVGVDPDDPVVRLAAEQGLRDAADEVGAAPDPI